MGGKISCTSRLGVGTSFKITLHTRCIQSQQTLYQKMDCDSAKNIIIQKKFDNEIIQNNRVDEIKLKKQKIIKQFDLCAMKEIKSLTSLVSEMQSLNEAIERRRVSSEDVCQIINPHQEQNLLSEAVEKPLELEKVFKIMIVNDEPFQLEVMCQQFQITGICDIERFNNGFEAF